MSTAAPRQTPKRKKPRPPGLEPGQIIINGQVRLPAKFADLTAFRQWCMSDEYPEHGDVFWLGGAIWVNVEMEDFSTHNLVKTEITRVLATVTKAAQLGYLMADRMRVVHDAASLSVEPDVMFVSFEGVRAGRAAFRPNDKNRVMEVFGTPDMVLEVASDSSASKDENLVHRYFAAGVAEYWRVDARGDQLEFDILRRGPAGFVPTPRRKGRIRSAVFGRSFRLTSATDPLGNPTFTLDVSGR